MNDRELLELAAKAAGIEIINAKFYEGPHYKGTTRRWNPLNDDGDALQLAVKLNMTLIPNDGCNMAFAHCEMISRGERNQVYQAHDGDQCAATRRAIVRAAAEIGRAME